MPVVLTVAAVAAVGGGAYALRKDDGAAPQRLAQPGPSACPTAVPTTPAPSGAPAPTLVLPAPGKVSFRLLNGTARDGLGRTLGDALATRGFQVKSTGNAPKSLSGPSKVYFGPGARPAAQLVAIHVIGAELSPVPTAPKGAVDLVIGSGFARLRTPAEVKTFTARVLAGTAPTAAPGTPATSAPRPTGCA
ncbi:MAG: LytR C-terminal domain-containing protein [Mycobacteriales bacterium]|nr:LytR C-terminal domain-containing protein [Mycobacteriales bacterium]